MPRARFAHGSGRAGQSGAVLTGRASRCSVGATTAVVVRTAANGVAAGVFFEHAIDQVLQCAS